MAHFKTSLKQNCGFRPDFVDFLVAPLPLSTFAPREPGTVAEAIFR